MLVVMDEHERELVLNALRNAPLSSRRARIADRPDLQPLFGTMEPARMREIQDGLLNADRLVGRLGEVTTGHLGRPCSVTPFSLSVIVRPSGYVDLDLSASLDCADADIAFEVSLAVKENSERPPPWPVDAWISVLCTRRPIWTACDHTVMEDRQEASTPEDVVRALQEEVRTFIVELPRIPAEALTAHDHHDPRTWP